MTEPSIYRLQAETNEESAKTAQKEFPEWAIIMYFYAALHFIKDYANERNELDKLEKKGNQSAHTSIINYVDDIAKDIKCNDLSGDYKILFRESLLARYLENDSNYLECSAREEYSQYTEKDWKTISGKLETIKKRLEQARNKYKAKEKPGKKP